MTYRLRPLQASLAHATLTNKIGDAQMRTKAREIPCRDEAGEDAVIIEWKIEPTGARVKNACCKEFSLPDGSPVTPLAGKFEHFYSGKLFTPV